MARLLMGDAVAAEINEETRSKAEELRVRGRMPVLAVVRTGDDPGDIAYERGAAARAKETGIEIRSVTNGADITQDEFISVIKGLNEDPEVDGILILRPLPPHIDDRTVCSAIDPAKDVDGISPLSMAGVFTGSREGFPPCTAEACVRIADYYDTELAGKRVTVLGRSLVIGKPVAMMMMERNATVTVCHSRTTDEDRAQAIRDADIVVAAVGRAETITAEALSEGQTVLDVGINRDEKGGLCGDFDPAGTEDMDISYTPVPGGIGRMTTAILMAHTVRAAETAERKAK